MEKPRDEQVEGRAEEQVEKITERMEEETLDVIGEEEEALKIKKNPVDGGPEESVVTPEGEFTEDDVEEEKETQLEGETETQEDNKEDKEKNEEEKWVKKYKKIIIASAISLSLLLIIYFVMSGYFVKRFYFGSAINAINVSGKTVEDVEALIAAQLEEYTLSLVERGGKIDKIRSSDVGLKLNSAEDIKRLKEGQNPFGWALEVFNGEKSKLALEVSFDERLLREQLDKLPGFDAQNIIEPKNPSFKYENNSFVIVEEIQGNKVDKDALYTSVARALTEKETQLDLEAANCYIKPRYTSKSPEVIGTLDTLNKYVSTKITYSYAGGNETLDRARINEWLSVNENLEISIDEGKVREYVDLIAKRFNSVGKTRSFVTSSGKTINIGGGDYGLSVNKSKEIEGLISAIKEGQNVTKQPAFNQSTFSGSDDIGNTYVEIDITNQHIWFYKNGTLIVEGNVVTGNVQAGNATPSGIYRLKYKEKNRVLRGPGYASPVTFWMPFNGGIGIHDASWRSTFGGTIYKTNGSHGCINSPYKVAEAIYNNIEPGTPVICY